MKKLSCSSDIGSVLIGNKNWTFAVPNIGGDGKTKIRIYCNKAEFLQDSTSNNMQFISTAQGTFNIYSYDCCFSADDCEIIETLTGRYGIYQGEWKVAFVKWE